MPLGLTSVAWLVVLAVGLPPQMSHSSSLRKRIELCGDCVSSFSSVCDKDHPFSMNDLDTFVQIPVATVCWSIAELRLIQLISMVAPLYFELHKLSE